MPNPVKTPLRHAVVDWFYDFGLEAALIVVAVLVGFAGVLYSDEFSTTVSDDAKIQRRIRCAGLILFCLFTLTQAVLAVLNFRRAKRISQLETQVGLESQRAAAAEETSAALVQDVFAICEGHLYVLATHGPLEFRSTDRISLYSHDEQSHNFLLLGRYSPNELWKHAGRKSYPSNQGCIGRAWENGEHYAAEFPIQGEPEFLNRCNEYAIPPEVAGALRMPSRFYFGWKVKDLAGIRGNAVLIIESTTARRYPLNELRQVFDGYAGYHLRDLVSRIAPRIPSARVAKEAGF